jgi:hypothetical protein
MSNNILSNICNRLIEKIYVVSSARLSRWKTRSYIFHMCLLLPYIGIFILMVNIKPVIFEFINDMNSSP